MAFGEQVPPTPGSNRRADLETSQLEQQSQQAHPPQQPISMQNTTLERISRLFATPITP
jgi:hypothetical protein